MMRDVCLLRLPEPLAATIEAWAAAEHRTFDAEVLALLTQAVAARSAGPPSPTPSWPTVRAEGREVK